MPATTSKKTTKTAPAQKKQTRKDRDAARSKARKPRPSSRRRKDRAGDGEDKVDKCEVPKCDEPVKRSISFKKAREAMEDWKLKEGGRRIHVCKEHYNDFKKATKRDRDMDRAGWVERAGRMDGKSKK